MKLSTAALSVATLSLAMLAPALAQTPDSSTPTTPSAGLTEAQHMVPARASLIHALNSKNVHAGDKFNAALSDTVHLNGGVVLHKGDTLRGEIATDNTTTPGASQLAIRFTEVALKNGQTVPIKATIVALYTPGDLIDTTSSEPDQIPNSWNDGTLRVDQENVMSGVDLHSQIDSSNSGVFVSTKKNNVKIPAGSEIALAIAARSNAPTTSGL